MIREIREKYAKLKNIPVNRVPDIIYLDGKKELEKLLGSVSGKFKGSEKSTIDEVLGFQKENGHIDCTIMVHYGDRKGDKAYQAAIFSMKLENNQLEETLTRNIPKHGEIEIEFDEKNSEAIAAQLRNYIKLRRAAENPELHGHSPFYTMGNYLCFDITSPDRFHMRPASMLFKKLEKYNKKQEDIILVKDGIEGTGILGAMALAINKGDFVTVKIEGMDGNSWKAAHASYNHFKNNFSED